MCPILVGIVGLRGLNCELWLLQSCGVYCSRAAASICTQVFFGISLVRRCTRPSSRDTYYTHAYARSHADSDELRRCHTDCMAPKGPST